MNDDQFEREKNYQVSIFLMKLMLKQEIILKFEFSKINKILLKKYKPILGSLYSKNGLI